MVKDEALLTMNPVMNLMPRNLQGRQNCVKCDDTTELSCPSCPKGKMCQYTVPTDDCTECSQAICVTDPSAVDDPALSEGGKKDSDGGPNVGAIAGGVIGGVIVIALITYLAWRYLIRPRRAEEAARQSAYGGSVQHQDSEKDGASRLTRRSSTHTVHSIASTVLTRASNIIQIAYIPGVTNRANHSSSGVLVPPVPPIPMQHSGQQNREPGQDEQHFFVPGDLRDSTYSGLSGYSDRTSYATRTSYAPRSSIASTIYGKQAQVMTPASTGMRAKPTMVSVKSTGSSGSGGHTPPVPEIDFEKFGNTRPKSGASTFSVGSTFLNTATQARAQVVKVNGGGLKKVEIPAKSGSTTPEGASAKDVGEGSTAITSPPAVMVNGSPFNDPPEDASTPTTPGLKSVSTPTLGAVMEDDEEKPANSPRPTSIERGSSPFGDEHATK